MTSHCERIEAIARSVRTMKQNKARLASGEWTEEDVWRASIQRAARELGIEEDAAAAATRREEAASRDADDVAYRSGQESLYRSQYGFSGEDVATEASLQQLLDLQTTQRRLIADLKKSKMPFRERAELQKEMRQMIADHTALLKALGIDRASRNAPTAADAWLTEYHTLLADGADFMQKAIDSAPEEFATATTEGELRVLAKHHGGTPYGIIDPLLANHRRVLGLPSELELGQWA
jgi:hypothetical protein